MNLTSSQQKFLDAVMTAVNNGGGQSFMVSAVPGAGKCVHPETMVSINHALMTAKSIYEKYQTVEVFDGEGYWSTPSTEIFTDSYCFEAERFVSRPIVALYRQPVKEVLKVLTLSDGSIITLTDAHKLFDGTNWTNQFCVGDTVCVPRVLGSSPKSQMPLPLVKLIAWMISEGHDYQKGKSATFNITQKSIESIAEIKSHLNDVISTFGLTPKKTNLIADRGVFSLRFWGVELRQLLESFGYVIGNRSAR